MVACNPAGSAGMHAQALHSGSAAKHELPFMTLQGTRRGITGGCISAHSANMCPAAGAPLAL